jgi:hypothetical protein
MLHLESNWTGLRIHVGRLKLKGMTAFSTESSWCEKAMLPIPANIWPANALILAIKLSNEACGTSTANLWERAGSLPQ